MLLRQTHAAAADGVEAEFQASFNNTHATCAAAVPAQHHNKQSSTVSPLPMPQVVPAQSVSTV